MKLTFLGHASFLVESKDGSVVFDPYYDNSVPGLVFPKPISADLCVCSHNHDDHIAKEYVKINAQPKSINYSIYEIPHDKFGGMKRGMNKICCLNIEGKKVVHLGDIGVVDKSILSNIVNCDVLLVPINGFFTISATEAKEVFDFVKPRIIIPMHYEIKNRGIGYPDGGQIAVFENLFPNAMKVKNSSIEIDEIPAGINCIIFEKIEQN